ncbi:MAG: hypothetical protein ACI4JM_01960 [Oscillospiraceae bacterium]
MHKVKGSGIIWAVCILAVTLIIITGVLSIAQINNKNTIDATKKQQAEYSAISAIRLVADDIQQEKNHASWLEMLWNSAMDMPLSKDYRIDNLEFEEIEAMGKISLVFEWESMEHDDFPYIMKITAEAEYYDEEAEVSATFEFTSDKKWILKEYSE